MKTPAEYKRDQRAKLKAAGFVPVTVWVPPAKRDKVRELERILRPKPKPAPKPAAT